MLYNTQRRHLIVLSPCKYLYRIMMVKTIESTIRHFLHILYSILKHCLHVCSTAESEKGRIRLEWPQYLPSKKLDTCSTHKHFTPDAAGLARECPVGSVLHLMKTSGNYLWYRYGLTTTTYRDFYAVATFCIFCNRSRGWLPIIYKRKYSLLASVH